MLKTAVKVNFGDRTCMRKVHVRKIWLPVLPFRTFLTAMLTRCHVLHLSCFEWTQSKIVLTARSCIAIRLTQATA